MADQLYATTLPTKAEAAGESPTSPIKGTGASLVASNGYTNALVSTGKEDPAVVELDTARQTSGRLVDETTPAFSTDGPSTRVLQM